nr:MAG TPA: hypothetical protein [Caudoviricetes sp.]
MKMIPIRVVILMHYKPTLMYMLEVVKMQI